jgi:hypothetical protein
MWSIIRRAILPVLLLIGGLASIIYGTIFHSALVQMEEETKTTIEVPSQSVPLGEALPRGEAPFGGRPQFVKKTVTRIDTVSIVESEPVLTREVTVGGVVRLDSGELKRTYSGKGPALCPT